MPDGWSFDTRGDFQVIVDQPVEVAASFRVVYGYVGPVADVDKMFGARTPYLFAIVNEEC